MKKILSYILIICLLSFPIANEKDINIAAEAVDKAIRTQTIYETKEEIRKEQIKEYKKEINSLKLENTIKDVLIVILAIARISLSH